MMRPAAVLDVERTMADVEATLERSLESEVPLLTEMARKTVLAGGKRLRPRIVLHAFAACGGRTVTPALVQAAAGMELIHAATLVHDDVIDQGATRRGVAATQREYGVERAIVLGDFLFVRGFAFSADQDAEVVRLTARACAALAEGELLEIQTVSFGEGRLDLQRYLRIIRGKTAAPLEACGRVGAHFAGRDDLQDALGAYGLNLGLAFQITDDLLDIRGDPARTGKPRGTDLRSGAPNAVVVLGAGNGARARLEKVLQNRVQSEAAVARVLDELTGSGAVQQAEALAGKYAQAALDALEAVPESPARAELARVVRGMPGRAA